MTWFRVSLIFLGVATTCMTVEAFVCFIGQEYVSLGMRQIWSIAVKDPCECTEFRLGGLNIRPQPRPTGDDAVHLLAFTTNTKEIREHFGCTIETTLAGPCQVYSPGNFRWKLQTAVAAPLTVELTISRSGYFYMTPDEKGTVDYEVYIGADKIVIYRRNIGGNWIRALEKGVNTIGAIFKITFKGNDIDVVLEWKAAAPITVEYVDPYPPPPSLWFIGIFNPIPSDWSFYKPCDRFVQAEPI